MQKHFKVGDELSPDDIEVGMIVDMIPNNSVDKFYRFKGAKVTSLNTQSFNFKYGDVIWNSGELTNYYLFYKGYTDPSEPSPETTAQQHDTLGEQSIKEAVKTLSQASQELSTGISVDEEGNIVIYSDYHQDEIKFDTTEKFMQYVECVKQMNKFGGSDE